MYFPIIIIIGYSLNSSEIEVYFKRKYNIVFTKKNVYFEFAFWILIKIFYSKLPVNVEASGSSQLSIFALSAFTSSTSADTRNMPSVSRPFSANTCWDSATCTQGSCLFGNRSFCNAITSDSVLPNIDCRNIWICFKIHIVIYNYKINNYCTYWGASLYTSMYREINYKKKMIILWYNMIWW